MADSTWQSRIDQWFRDNPNASLDQIQQAVSQFGLTGYDKDTGNFTVPYDTASYNSSLDPFNVSRDKTNFYNSQEGTDFFANLDSDPNASWRTVGNTATGFNPEFWNNPVNSSYMDEMLDAMRASGMTHDEVSRMASYYGMTPETLGSMASNQFNSNKPFYGVSPDDFIQDMYGNQTDYFSTSDNTLANYSKNYLSTPYSSVGGQGDMYLGLKGRNYTNDFINQVLPELPIPLLGKDLDNLSSPYFDATDPFAVTALPQDINKIRADLIDKLGTSNEELLQSAAKYLYGVDLPSVDTPPITTDNTPTDNISTWTGKPSSPIIPSNIVNDNPFSGPNWRDTVISGTGMSMDELYRMFYSAMQSGDENLASLESKLGLNPGQIMALYDKVVSYAKSNNLTVPLLQAVTNANKPYYNYGFNPGQKLYTRSTGSGEVVNPISAYLDQIYALRAQNEDATTTDTTTIDSILPTEFKASGGVVGMKSGGLTSIHKDPAIKKYISKKAGGQDDVVPLMAAPGEYVIDADVVSALGDGNTQEGVRKLDKLRQNVREHKRSAPSNKIPPKAKNISQYMKG